MQRHKQAMHMKNRQAVDEHITLAPTPVVFEHLGIGEQIAVAEHGTFAAAGGAAGIDHGRQIVCLARGDGVHIAVLRGTFEQAALALVVQGEHVVRTGLKRQFADPSEIARATDQHRGFGIAQKILQLGALVGHIERQIHIAGAQRGQVEQHGFD